MTAMPLEEFTDAEQAALARIEAAELAPEAYDPAIWRALTDLLPCHPDVGCADECECTSGELRLAIERLIMRERFHMSTCESDGCCDRSHRLTVHVDVMAMAR